MQYPLTFFWIAVILFVVWLILQLYNPFEEPIKEYDQHNEKK